MEFSFYHKKWWQIEVPDDEKEKEYAHNVKREYKKKSDQDNAVDCKCTEPMAMDKDYWSIANETDDEAVRRRMIEACHLRQRKLRSRKSIYVKAAMVFGAISLLGIVIVALYYLVDYGDKDLTLFSNKTGNYIDPN